MFRVGSFLLLAFVALNSVSASADIGAMLDKCVACHRGSSATEAWLKSATELRDHLPYLSDRILQRMLELGAFSEAERADFIAHVRELQQSSPISFRTRLGDAVRFADACYLGASRQTSHRNSLPKADGASSPLALRYEKARAAGSAVFYDRESVPLAWQESSYTNPNDLTRVLKEGRVLSPAHPVNGFMYENMGYHSDGAREFPWKHTAGLDATENGSATKFILLPPETPLARLGFRDRKSHPTYFGKSFNANGPQRGWEFLPGTVFGEVLFVKDPKTDRAFPFEIRLRAKVDETEWKMDVLRPFATPTELAGGVRKLCARADAPAGCAEVSSALVDEIRLSGSRVFDRREFVNKERFETKRDPLSLSSTALEALAPRATLQELPELPTDVVAALLETTPFQSVFGRPWIEESAKRPAGWAPTTKASFHVVPKNYFAGFIPMKQSACLKCHDSAGHHVDNFDPTRDQMFAPFPGDAPRPRTWYDFIPGDDRILSWHPFSSKAIENGDNHSGDVIEPCLTKSGLVTPIRDLSAKSK